MFGRWVIHDEIDWILMCMAEWCFAFLKWWMMGCDIFGLGNYWWLHTMIVGRWSLSDLKKLRYYNRERHQSQLRSKKRLMFISDVKCDEIDKFLMCMAEWCFAFLKWWMMGCDISDLATTGNFIMVALSLALVTGCTYRMHGCVCGDAALLGFVFQISIWAIHLREDTL